LPCIESGLNGSIITQLSDVEDETNGFLTYDRRVLKVSVDKLKTLFDGLYQTFDKHFN
jgi:hypothetical protein